MAFSLPTLRGAPFAGASTHRRLAALTLGLLSFSASAASSVAISQVYGGGGNAGALYRNDFIELSNRGAAPVSLNGWRVQYASATATAWTVAPLPDVTLQAGQYLQMQQATGAGGSTGLPAPEASGNIAMSATAGKVLPTLNVQAAAVTSHTIPQIQGSGASSPFVGTMQTTEGVVTLVVSNGFYLQDPAGDGDPSTSDGIFVFTGAAPAVTAGDRVRLSATVAEFLAGDAARTVTQLTGVSGLVVLSRNNSVAPTAIALPLASAADFERYEGMLVRHAAPLTVSQNYFQGRYGQVSLSAGRLEKPTNRYPARSAQAIAAAAANAANLLVLDDRVTRQNPNPVPYIGADNTLRAGDRVTGLTGVIDFGLITASNPGPSGYKLQPSVTPVFSRENARTAAPLVPLGNVKVASFNVLNFFTTFTDGTTAAGLAGQGCSLGASVTRSNCRGADNLAEFLRQRAKIVTAMAAIDADVYGLMEIQNNGDAAAANLVAALNSAVGANTYAVVPRPGFTGTDAIRVAMIYKPSRLSLVGTALSDPDLVNNRPPMAQTFAAANGQTFSLIVNHLKSKGRCPAAGDPDADRGDGQGCWNATRVKQAQRLAGIFVPQVQSAASDPDVLVIGDLNAYGFEDPVNTLVATGFVNQVERFVRRSALPYSYVFDGEAGYLDHALASAALSNQVLGVTQWHINADEPSVIDYNTEFKPQDLYTASPYRSSDHDPVVVSLNLQPGVVEVTARLSLVNSDVVFNRATQTSNTTLSLTNISGGGAIRGPLQVELRNLPAGVTLDNGSGLRDGLPTVTVAPGNLAPGQTVAVPLNFRNPSKVTLSYTPRVYSGNF